MDGGPSAAGRPGISPNATGRPGGFSGLGGIGSLARPGESPGTSPTVAVNQQSLVNQANQVRNDFNINNNYNNYFNGNWWGRHPGAWRAAGWDTGGYGYNYPTWFASYSYCGYANSEPSHYDYGSNVVYEREYVYVNGDAVATHEEYGRQAESIADKGRLTRASQDDDWLPLGVFAIIQGGQATGNDLFQLAVNKSGVIRGNYYNALSDTNLPVAGSVDEKSQRAAWTIGDRSKPVFEAGHANLTEPQTTMLVHFGNQGARQWTLVRMEQQPNQPGK
jgi:hypothetical protein